MIDKLFGRPIVMTHEPPPKTSRWRFGSLNDYKRSAPKEGSPVTLGTDDDAPVIGHVRNRREQDGKILYDIVLDNDAIAKLTPEQREKLRGLECPTDS